MSSPYPAATSRYLEAQQALDRARAQFDLLARRGLDTTNAAYALHQAQTLVEQTRHQMRAATDDVA